MVFSKVQMFFNIFQQINLKHQRNGKNSDYESGGAGGQAARHNTESKVTFEHAFQYCSCRVSSVFVGLNNVPTRIAFWADTSSENTAKRLRLL